MSCAPTDNEALFDSNLEVFPPAVPQVYVAEDKARHCTCPQVCLFAQRDFIQIVTQHFLRCWSHGHIQKSSMRHRHKKFNSVYRLHDRFQIIYAFDLDSGNTPVYLSIIYSGFYNDFVLSEFKEIWRVCLIFLCYCMLSCFSSLANSAIS